jgi:hypothetical protein
MKKTIRAFALLSVLSVAVSPILRAEVMGTNPRPQVAASSLSWLDVAYTVLRLYGF